MAFNRGPRGTVWQRSDKHSADTTIILLRYADCSNIIWKGGTLYCMWPLPSGPFGPLAKGDYLDQCLFQVICFDRVSGQYSCSVHLQTLLVTKTFYSRGSVSREVEGKMHSTTLFFKFFFLFFFLNKSGGGVPPPWTRLLPALEKIWLKTMGFSLLFRINHFKNQTKNQEI